MKKIFSLILLLLMTMTSCSPALQDTSSHSVHDSSVSISDSSINSSNSDDSINSSNSDDSINSSNPDDSINSSNPDDSINSSNPDDFINSSNPDDSSSEETNPPQNEHTYVAVVTVPTCDGEGFTTYTCSDCGDSYVANKVEALGHSYTSVVTAPTCDAEGYTTYTCSACGDSYVGDKVDQLEHSYKSVVTKPTCDAEGYTTYTCSNCGDSYVADKVDQLEHSYKSVVTAPTCDAEGYTTYTCSDCGDSYVGDKVGQLEHSYKSVVTKPTCDADGYTTYTCALCGDSYQSDKVDALGHNYIPVVTEPTCDSEGYTTYTCSNCDDSYVGDKVASLEHDYTMTATDPTCLNMGYTTYVCNMCDDTYISDYIDALGHAWVDATTEAPKTCTACGATEGDKLNSSTPSTPVTAPTLSVTYINVGQGDSMLIKVEDCDILIDAGTASYGATVSTYLKNQKVDDLELVINTHPDADHCGGLTKVFQDHAVEEVWISKDTSKTTAAYKNFTSAIKSEGLTAQKPNAGTVYTYGYLTLTVIYSQYISGDSNNSSIVVMLEYGSFKFLFTGDVGQVAEPSLISSGYDISCDVLKVGHHGSKYSSTTAFLNKVKAEYGVICVGSNSYGHPTSEALNRLSAAGTTVYRTDKNGDVKFSTDGNTLYLPNGGTDTTGSGSGLPSNGGSTSGGSTSDGTTTSDMFIGNTETKVFHLPTCSSLPSASKQNVMYNYWWIINIAGYKPCGRCLKNYSTVTTYIANATSKVYHVSTCSYLPSASNRVYITSTAGYTPCGHCIH